MSESLFAKSATNAIRIALGIGGVAALIVGILILVWPGKTAMLVAGIIAVYAIVTGLVYAASGIFSKYKGGWSRVGHIVLGAIFVIAGIVAFSNLGLTAATLGVLLGFLVGVMWIVEGITALTTVKDYTSKTLPIVFAILSILAGLVLLFSPLFAVLVLFWILGITLIIQGIVNIVRAFAFGAERTPEAAPETVVA
ncbi:HdeD family acid-resistance protein [Brachybacterium sp. DNPG3]